MQVAEEWRGNEMAMVTSSTISKQPLAGAGLILALLAGSGPAAAATSAGTFTAAAVHCSAFAGGYEPGLLSPVLDLAPIPYWPAGLPELSDTGPPVMPREPVMAGPDCPSSAETPTERASATASVDSTSGRWSVDVDATTERDAAYASAVINLSATIDSAVAGDLHVVFDEVTGEFLTSCDHCTGHPQAGYLTTIRVESSAGVSDIRCGTGSFTGPEETYTLPDDRCGLDERGNAVRLSVGPGLVQIDIWISGAATVSGPGSSGPASLSQATTMASARVAAFEVSGESSSPAAPAEVSRDATPPVAEADANVSRGEVPSRPSPVVLDPDAGRGASGTAPRADELARAGMDSLSMTMAVAAGAVVVGSVLAASETAAIRRRRAILALRGDLDAP